VGHAVTTPAAGALSLSFATLVHTVTGDNVKQNTTEKTGKVCGMHTAASVCGYFRE